MKKKQKTKFATKTKRANKTSRPKATSSGKAMKSRGGSAKEKLDKMVHQFREPISLLSTFRQEGLANAMNLLTIASSVASQATRRVQFDSIGPTLKEAIHSMGFALKSDLEKIEERMEELELKLSEAEIGRLEEE